MELSLPRSPLLPPSSPKPNTELLKQNLIKKGVTPTPKILHALRKKQIQKSNRRSKKLAQSQPQIDDDNDDSRFESIKAEYRAIADHLELKGKPWERKGGFELEGFGVGKLKGEHLDELREVLEERNGEGLRWVLDDDVEEAGGSDDGGVKGVRLRENVSEDEKIRFLVKRLSYTNLSIQDWKFSRVMKQSGIIFSEMHLLRIIERLGKQGNWKLAMSVVEWVYNQKDYEHHKSRFVYTKLLSVLGKARRYSEASQIFNYMRGDGKLYPDLAAYHAIAVMLGQAGLVNELISIIECMRQKPSKNIKNMKNKSWDPRLEPDIIIYNAVLNACVPSHQWKGVSWVLQQMRLSGLKPTETTYGLAMEVMLKSGKYDRVHKYFETMRRGGLATRALTYKVLVQTFGEEGKVDEAVEAVRDMERRGVVGTASVYYELACCLCNKGRWQDALAEVEKLKRLPRSKPLEVTFTGMILSSLDGGHTHNCISIFEYMKDHAIPNIGTINAMLKVYSQSDMFARARQLFESINDNGTELKPDEFTYNSMLEASALAQQWEYFEFVYKETALCGFRLDQSKHARLLVAASRAGKWHLLEHAIDSILETGEIPHKSLFTEMINNTILQQNFERTVTIINGMAHASMQVSESQWTNILERIDKEKLQNLSNYLDYNSSNLVMEDPVPNFIKSVKSHGQIPSEINLILDVPRDINAEDFTFDESSKGLKLRERNSDSSICDSSLDFLTADIESSFSKAPSALDILETWKQDRINDGVSPFRSTYYIK